MRVCLLVASIVFLAGCGDSPTQSGGTNNKTVEIFTVGVQFSPTFATLAPGDTARWHFALASDNMGHNVRFIAPRPAGTPADINILSTGTMSRVFTTKGVFDYVCDVHPGMNASITVQ